jgi:hypothetical protein
MSLVASWSLQSGEPETREIEIHPDGTMVYRVTTGLGVIEIAMTWRMEDDQLICTHEDGGETSSRFRLDGDALELEQGGETFRYRRLP